MSVRKTRKRGGAKNVEDVERQERPAESEFADKTSYWPFNSTPWTSSKSTSKASMDRSKSEMILNEIKPILNDATKKIKRILEKYDSEKIRTLTSIGGTRKRLRLRKRR